MPISADILSRLESNDPSLVELNLNSKILNDEDVILLCDKLNKNTHLRTLNLSSNFISSIGAKALAQNKTIKSLNLHFNHIGTEGAIALANHPVLESLDISDNQVALEGTLALTRNLNLKKINASNQGSQQLTLVHHQQQFCLKHFNAFNTIIDLLEHYPAKVIINAMFNLFKSPKDFMDDTGRSLTSYIVLSRHEALKSLSLTLQSKKGLFARFPKEIIINQLYPYLLPQKLIDCFVRERQQPKSYCFFSNREVLNLHSNLLLLFYGMVVLYLNVGDSFTFRPS